MDDIRDIVLIAALIGLSLVMLVGALVMAFAASRSLRGLRAVQRLHDRRVPSGLDQLQTRMTALNERQAWEPGGLGSLIWAVYRRLRAWRRRRRFAFLRR